MLKTIPLHLFFKPQFCFKIPIFTTLICEAPIQTVIIL